MRFGVVRNRCVIGIREVEQLPAKWAAGLRAALSHRPQLALQLVGSNSPRTHRLRPLYPSVDAFRQALASADITARRAAVPRRPPRRRFGVVPNSGTEEPQTA